MFQNHIHFQGKSRDLKPVSSFVLGGFVFSQTHIIPLFSHSCTEIKELIQHIYHDTFSFMPKLTHWGRVTHICVSELPIIGSDNGLSPGRRQAIIWTNAGILLIRTLGINFSEILSKIHTFSFKKMYLKISSAKRQPFCLELNVLTSNKRTISRVIIRDVTWTWTQLLCWYFLLFTNTISIQRNVDYSTSWHLSHGSQVLTAICPGSRSCA